MTSCRWTGPTGTCWKALTWSWSAGLRDWFTSLPTLHAKAAAFDTRVDMPAVLTGRASKGIGRRLRQHGLDLLAEPESFLVTKQNHLEPDETTRAPAWAGSWPTSSGHSTRG